MTEREPMNTPLLAGWAIATGVAAVAFGAAYVPVGIDANGSVAIAVVLWLIVGGILGLPRRDLPPPNTVSRVSAPSAPTVAPAPPAAAPASAAPSATPVAPVPPAADTTDSRPVPLPAPRGGQPDDLKKIKGVGPALESLLHEKGYYHYDQIAGWTEAEIAWIDENLEGVKGRASRDAWVAQAKVLTAGGDPEKTGN